MQTLYTQFVSKRLETGFDTFYNAACNPAIIPYSKQSRHLARLETVGTVVARNSVHPEIAAPYLRQLLALSDSGPGRLPAMPCSFATRGMQPYYVSQLSPLQDSRTLETALRKERWPGDPGAQTRFVAVRSFA